MEEELRGPDLSPLHYFLLTNSRRGEISPLVDFVLSDWWTPLVPVGIYSQMVTLLKAKESQKNKTKNTAPGKEVVSDGR